MERQKKIIAENLSKVRKEIALAAAKSGRKAEEVKLVAVTKGRSLAKIKEIVSLGITDLGENRIEELEAKAKEISGVKWHFIGNIQSNKISKIVELSEFIHSLCSLKHAIKINEKAKEQGKKISVFVEVNVSGEDSKSGLKENELESFLNELKKFENLEVLGLMTMAPLIEAEKTRKYFGKLKVLADRFGLKELSMGMSNDFKQAIEEGASFVRIGTALFG